MPAAPRRAPTSFANRVREARLDAGMSQDELATAIRHATKTKANKSLISQWENGHIANPQNAIIDALSTITGYTHKWLSTGKGPKKLDLDAALKTDQDAHPLDREALAAPSPSCTP